MKVDFSLAILFSSDFSKAYWIVEDDGRKYTISEGMHNKLNAEYNNSVAGHKLNIFFNVKKNSQKRSYQLYGR